MRTLEHERAIFRLQNSLTDRGLEIVSDLAEMLAGVPIDEMEKEINTVGRVMTIITKRIAPNLSAEMQVAMPFALECPGCRNQTRRIVKEQDCLT